MAPDDSQWLLLTCRNEDLVERRWKMLVVQDVDHEQYDYEDGECDQGHPRTASSRNQGV